MKALLNDGLDKEGIELFNLAGIETDTRKRKSELCLIEDIGQFDVLVVRSATQVRREVIKAGAKGKLKIIGRAGVGYDNIDIKAAAKYNVIVKNAPFASTNAVAELTLGLMLSVSRNIPQAYQSLKNGIWTKEKLKGTELSYKTLGILGCGRIGQRVRDKVRGFDMEVIGYDVKPCVDSGIKFMSKEEVLKRADYVTIHTGGKEVIIGEKEFALMKPTAYLINTSRGVNVNQDALCRALKEKRIAGAAFDVYSGEPKTEGAPFNNKLHEFDNVILSSHLGALTKEAQRATSEEIARVISNYLLRGDYTNAVNVGKEVGEERPIRTIFIKNKNVPGAYGAIDNILAAYGISIVNTQSRELNSGEFVSTVYRVYATQAFYDNVGKAIEQIKALKKYVIDVKI